MSKMYELYIYTAGNQDYAQAIANILDEHKHYFTGRVISRDDYTDVDIQHKKLDKVSLLHQNRNYAVVSTKI